MLEKIGLDVKFATRPRNTFLKAMEKVLRGLVANIPSRPIFIALQKEFA